MTNLALTVYRQNRIASLTRARKYHRCAVCQELINKGDQYYAITFSYAGLGSIKFPERCHIECMDKFFSKKEVK